MSKKSKSTEGSIEQDGDEKVIHINAGDESHDQAAPVRTEEILPHVITCVDTITGCSEAELANARATLDFVNREVTMQMCDMWKEICRVAQKTGKEGEKAAKVSLAVKIDIDHTSLLMVDTGVTTSFALKFKKHETRQENLAQGEMKLSANGAAN